MNLITSDELRTLLLAQTTSAMISMVCVTAPDMRAKNSDGLPNPFRIGRGANAVLTICKANKVNGNIASRYDTVVENRLGKEIQSERIDAGLPPLDAKALETEVAERFRKGTSWHRPIMADDGPTCLSVNKNDSSGDRGEAYLRFIFKAKGNAEYLRIDSGETEPTENVNGFLSPVSDYGNQGLEDSVKFVCYKLSSIVEIAIGGERYRISDNFTNYPLPTRKNLWNIAEEYLNGERKMAAV